MNVPENHVVTEGRSLRAAIDAAAEKLGVPSALVEHKIDLAHFRSAQGTGIGSDTVKIYAWPKQAAPPATPAVADAEKWAKELLSGMGIQGQVRSAGQGNTVSVLLDAGESAPFLVGKRGITVRAIQYLLGESMKERYAGTSFQVDIAGGGAREDDRPRRDEDRPRRDEDRPRRDDDRGSRRDDRPRRDDDRRPRRDDDRGPRRDDDRRDRRPSRRDDEEELKKLARRLAQKVLETGEPQMIRRDMNAYDRRVVHVEVGAIEGVRTRSVGEGPDRRVEILLAEEGAENTES